MRAQRLNSAMIARIGFDESDGTLSVWFRNARRYTYFGVPKAIYDGLRSAASAGRFFNDCVKGRFDCRPDAERRRFRPQH